MVPVRRGSQTAWPGLIVKGSSVVPDHSMASSHPRHTRTQRPLWGKRPQAISWGFGNTPLVLCGGGEQVCTSVTPGRGAEGPGSFGKEWPLNLKRMGGIGTDGDRQTVFPEPPTPSRLPPGLLSR